MASTKYYTPQIRFATPGQAALRRMVQTVESTVQTPSDHVTKAGDFSGVMRYRRDFRKYLVSNLFPPSLTDANPTIIPTTLASVVDLTGSNFTSGTRVFLNNQEADATTFIDENHLQINIFPLAAMEGPIDVYVLRPDTFSAHNSDILKYENPPEIGPFAPLTGWMEGGELVHVTGSSFKQGSSVSFGFSPYPSVTSSNVTWLGNQFLDVFTPAPPDAAVSATNFTTGLSSPFFVKSPDGLSSPVPGIFYYTFHAPTGTALSQATGSTEGGDTIQIYGSWFNPGATVTVGTASLPLLFVSHQTATFTTPAHITGTVSVVVVNPDTSASSPITFQYTAQGIPRIVSVTSTFVSPAGTNIVKSGTVLNVSGNNYTSTLDPLIKATSVLVDGASASFSIVDRQHLSVTIPFVSGGMGFYSVQVSGAYGVATLPAAVRYLVAPNVIDYNPKSGSVLGGNTVSVTATNLLGPSEMTVTVGGVPITTWTQIGTGTIVFTMPSHSLGVGTIVLNLLGLVSGSSATDYSWVQTPSLGGPFYPNPVG